MLVGMHRGICMCRRHEQAMLDIHIMNAVSTCADFPDMRRHGMWCTFDVAAHSFWTIIREWGASCLKPRHVCMTCYTFHVLIYYGACLSDTRLYMVKNDDMNVDSCTEDMSHPCSKYISRMQRARAQTFPKWRDIACRSPLLWHMMTAYSLWTTTRIWGAWWLKPGHVCFACYIFHVLHVFCFGQIMLLTNYCSRWCLS